MRLPLSPWALGLLAAGVAGVLYLGPRALPWAALLALGGAGWSVWHAWYEAFGPGRVIRALAAAWLELPGAELRAGAIRVHDGVQPLAIQVGRRRGVLSCTLETQVAVQPFALRAWPVGKPAPALGIPVERAPALEARFARTMSVESNDRRAAERWLGTEVATALASVAQTGALGGLTFDGERLVLHLTGPVVADPPRAAGLFRGLWAALA